MGEILEYTTSGSLKMIYNLQEEAWDFDKEIGMKATMMCHRLVQRRPSRREMNQRSHIPCWSYTDAVVDHRSAKMKSTEYFKQ